MSNLYQDAILDAKALRASAMANAKAALEEAFEPKIQEMLRLKLSEELDELEEVEEAEEGEMQNEVDELEENDINEAELEEILSQLEELSKKEEGYEEEGAIYEAKEDEEEKGEEEGEEEEDGEGEELEVADEEPEGDETKVVDITLGDLKKVIQDAMSGGMSMGAEMPTADSEAEAEVSLDEILDELEMEEEGFETAGRYTSDSVQPADTEGWKQHFGGQGLEEDDAEEVSSKETAYKKKAPHQVMEKNSKTSVAASKKDTAYKTVAKNQPLEEELEKAKSTISKLRQDLQEVNLLNAKYLYMNKLFKSKNLNESQKVKVINALDRATNVAEVKNTYETLKESFESKKSQLKESFGFASQAAGIAPKTPIIESNNAVSRWQKLAGIK